MRITNHHKTDLGLPNGQALKPSQPTLVRDWSTIKKNLVVAAWLRAGILSESGDDNSAQEKDELIARLAALGVKVDKRKSIEQLQAMVAEAEAKLQDVLLGSNKLPAHVEFADGTTVQLGEVVARAHADSGLSVEDWNALPEDERELHLEEAIAALKAERG